MRRRISPDGVERNIRTFKRGKEVVYAYPWTKMLVGDFFVAPVGGRSKAGMQVAFRQAAARHDIEVSIQPWTMGDGSEAFRVIKVQENIKAVKRKAAAIRGINIPASDGRWLDRRKTYARVSAGIREDERPKPVTVSPSRPSRPPVSVEEGPSADIGYDRAERLRKAREAAAADLGLEPEDVNYFEENEDGE